MIERAYRYRFYPDAEQEELLAKTFGCCRFVFNHFLQERETAWKTEKKGLGYNECAKRLKALKSEYLFLKEVSSVCLQQSLRHLQRAFENFFKKRARYPSYKKKHRLQSSHFMRNAFTYKDGQITLAKCKTPLNIIWSRRFSGEPSSLTITKDTAGRYFISFIVAEEIAKLPFSKGELGIDLGLTVFATDNTGRQISSPRFLEKKQKILKGRQKALSKKVKGSKNRSKAIVKVAKIHAKVRDKRHDFLHKLSTKLVHENQVIAVESLAVKEMQKNRLLSRRIADSGWRTFLRFLSYKCSWYGKNLVEVGRYFPSSKQCSGCHYVVKELPLSVRKWQCPSCHIWHDRETNAGINLIVEGLRLLAQKMNKSTVGLTGV